jgi:hypothetical protein
MEGVVMADERINFSRFAESEGVSQQQHPQRETRTQAEKERAPDYHQRAKEREGGSEWSGGSMGGGTWAGRSR